MNDLTALIQLDLQKACEGTVPAVADFERWTTMAISQQSDELPDRQPVQRSLCIRLVDAPESAALNAQYRGQAGATNVLSFVAEPPPGLPADEAASLLGDVVICAPLVAPEAEAENRSPGSHWALLTVHGVLHLLGYDHQTDAAWRHMTALESAILKRAGLPDPWPSRLSKLHP